MDCSIIEFRIGDGSYVGEGNPYLEGGPFNGTIDDVMIFNRSLTAAEIAALYANTSSRYVYKNFTSLSDGNHTVKVYTQDIAGNIDYVEAGISVNEVLSCGAFTTSGEFTLGSDLYTSSDCFTIESSNVIIDGAGYSLVGDGGAGDYGIQTGVDASLKNITIKSFGNIGNFSRGINLDQVNESLIYNNTMRNQIASNTYAIYLTDVDSNVISDNDISWNSTIVNAVYLTYSAANLGRNNFTGNKIFVNGSTAYGFYMTSGFGANHDGDMISENNITIKVGSSAYGIYNLIMANSKNNIIRSNNITVSSASGGSTVAGMSLPLLGYRYHMLMNLL
jgi:hypothetical protein